MKEIKAYIKEFKREAVTRALHEIDGLTGTSFSDILGFGRGKEKSLGFNPDAPPRGYVLHVKVEIVCEDELAATIVNAIHRAARTGLRGDGRIYVSDVEREILIQDEPSS